MAYRKLNKLQSAKLSALINKGFEKTGKTAQSACDILNLDGSTLSLIRSKKRGLKKEYALLLACHLEISPRHMVEAAGHHFTRQDAEDLRLGLHDSPTALNHEEIHELFSRLCRKGVRKGHLLAMLRDNEFNEAVASSIQQMYQLRS